MKKYLILLLLCVLMIPFPAVAGKTLGVDEFTSIDELAGAIAAYFPKVQGEVKAIQGGSLTLTLGRKEGLTSGMELTLWREGREILHPVTGAVIGRMEDEVGTVEVTNVGDASSTAVVKKKLKDPKPGDKARITPKKISIAIVPVRSDRPEIVQGLAERLIDYGRFTVLDREKTSEFLKDKNQRDTALVKEMGSRFNLDAVIAVGVYPTEGKLLVTTRIFYTEDGSTLDTIISTLDLKTKKDALGEIQPFFTPAKEEKSVTPELPFDARYFAAGDFEGDGKLEYVFSDGSKLHLYRQEPSGWREVWTETLASESQGLKQINIDAADINGNGRPEIFVTAMQSGKVFSYAVEFKDGSYRRIAEVPGFLRVLAYPGGGTLLLGQAYDPATFFSGQPRLFSWTGGKYAAGAEFPLPKGLTLYGFAVAEFGEAQPLLVGFDDDDHLVVYSKNTPLWKSEEQYSAVDTFVYKPATGVGAVLTKQVSEGDKSLRVRIRGRVMAVDINGDGRDEIIVPKNTGGAFLGGFTGAEMNGLGWTGARLDQRWNIKDIPGPVLDFQVRRQAKAGTQILTLVRTKGSLFSKDRQQVMSYAIQ